MTKKRLIALLAAAAMLASSSAALAAEKDAPETAAAVVTEAVTAEEEAVPQAQEIPEAPAELADDAYESPVSNAVSAVYDDETTGGGSSINSVISTLSSSSVSVTLNDNITENVVIPEGKTVTIDLNGHKITNVSDHTITNYGTLTINDSSNDKSGVVDNVTHQKAAVYNIGTIEILGGKYNRSLETGNVNKGETKNSWYTIYNNGTMEIGSDAVVRNSGDFSSMIINIGSTNKTATLNITGGDINGGICSVKNDEFGILNISGGEIKNDEYYAIQNWNKMTISGGIISSKRAVISNGVWNEENYKTEGKAEITGGEFTATGDSGIIYEESGNGIEKGEITITGGTFSTDIGAYTPDGYYQKETEDGKYTVATTNAKFNESAQALNYSVTLEGLKNNGGIAHKDDAVYGVKLGTVPQSIVDELKPSASPIPEGAIVQAMDIEVTETLDGVSKDVDISKQKTVIGLQKKAETATVYHYDSGWSQVYDSVLADDGMSVSFTANSFSPYAVVISPAAVTVDSESITKKIGVAFKKKADDDVYEIYLKSEDSGKQINRYLSADLTFKLTSTDGTLTYTVNPAAGVTLIDNGNDRYEFNLDGKDDSNASGVSGEQIKIGELTLGGYGKGRFEVDTNADTNADTTNIVHTAKVADNIVDDFTPNGDGTNTGKLVLNGAVSKGEGIIDNIDRKPVTKDLTINVAFPNEAKDNAAAYQGMKVTVSGGDLAEEKVYDLGTGESNVEYTAANGTDPAKYTVTVSDALTKNTAYTVTVEGAGYRTARYTVNMTDNKTLNFWNNVKDANNAAVIEVGSDALKAVTKNFLAGDIVADGKINIYDLSAVVSYFGTENDTDKVSQYAKYDLNRDGKIDSKDIAYVLVSWGE